MTGASEEFPSRFSARTPEPGMELHRVLHLDDLVEGHPRRFELSGRAVLVTKIDGEPHAISDVCPHNGASLSEGVIKDGCVTCLWHFWRFSLHDGARQGSPQISVEVFGTRLTAEGWIEVEVPAQEPTKSLREHLLESARRGPVSHTT